MNKAYCIKCFFLATITSLLLTYCSNEKKSKDAAEESNLQKFENKVAEKDAGFLVDATSGSYDLIKITSVAIARTANAAIKKIAEELKDEHSAMITELNSMASNKSVTIANTASQQAIAAAIDLNETSMKSFDKDWVNKVEDLHKVNVKTYEDASNESKDANIKSWASVSLLKIRGHLERIKKLSAAIK